MRRLLIPALLAAALVVAAAEPAEVATRVVDDGYFIEQGADATDAVVGRAVSDARSEGSRFFVVVLAEEPASGATFYADSILDRLPGQEGTVLVVAPETVGWAQNLDIWATDQLDAALEASLEGETSDDVVSLFVGDLVGATSGSTSSGSGLSVLLVIAVVVGAGIAFVVWWSSRSSKRRQAEHLAELKAKARAQIDAVANDILDDEDEVAEAKNPEATRHFESATTIYSGAEERLANADTVEGVVDVAADLDDAIWHLDAAEAILDGKAIPDKPERPSIPDPQLDPAMRSEQLPPLPTYERRSGRRSGFGADDMVKAVIAMQAMRSLSGGGRRTRSQGSGGSRSRSRSSGRSRGGGRRRG